MNRLLGLSLLLLIFLIGGCITVTIPGDGGNGSNTTGQQPMSYIDSI